MAKFVGKAGSDTLTGTAFGDLIFGLAGNDSLSGGIGPDTLNGGAGIDTLAGGLGNDSYVVDTTKDTISDAGGTDDRALGLVSIDLTLSRFAGIEHAALQGNGALKAIGNGGDNILAGNFGANTLDGGIGADTLIGGNGNDSYIVDSLSDDINEYPGGGIDTVFSNVESYVLDAGVENLTIGAGLTFGFGNELANKIVGNAGDNHVESGAGNDTVIGNGGNQDVFFGGDGNDLLSTGNGDDNLYGDAGADTMAGGKGNDEYAVDDKGDKIVEAAGGGQDQVLSSISYTLGANLEGLYLSNPGTIGIGNGLDNFVEGQAGNQTLYGMAGKDTIEGGVGDDLLFAGLGDDELRANVGADTLVGGAGKDRFTAVASAGFVADDIMDFEMGLDRIDLTGVLTGHTGLNLADYVKTAVVDGSTIVSIDFDGAGVLAFQDTFHLVGIATDVDGLLTTGSLVVDPLPPPGFAPPTGTAGNDTLTGLASSELMRGLGGSDNLSGDFGFDTLDGGTGADTLAGGNGSDTYSIDSTKDVVNEVSGAFDSIRASISIDLTKYTGIENVVLTGAAALKTTGDAGANLLIGNSGNNTFDGGEGTDTMIGGVGNDTYFADGSESATVVELFNEGFDTVIAAGNYTLGANIENLILAPPEGVIVPLNRSGTGNDLGNKIVSSFQNDEIQGLGGNDTIDSGKGKDLLDGGSGNDLLIGGLGADTYVVDSASDKIVETGADLDIVFSFISHTLAANVENLQLVSPFAINGTGNAAGNEIAGGDGKNQLLGLAGNDTMTGGAEDDFLSGGIGDDALYASVGSDVLFGGVGKDAFKADPATADNLADSIIDFEFGSDSIDLTSALTGYTGANLNDYVTTATVGGDTVISIDFDGAGAGAARNVFTLIGVATDVNGLLANGALKLNPAPAIAAQPIGTAGADTLAGSAESNLIPGMGGNDALLGFDGNDTLDGGAGNDHMNGGNGDDTYVINSAGDSINDSAGSSDRIRYAFAIDLTLAKFAGIENVTLTGNAAVGAKGDEFANNLIGNNAANKLDGGLGADFLIGGLGNDIYIVDSVGDAIWELAGGGTDSVISTAIAYTLSDDVEILTLAAGGGDGTGNALNNKITGNATVNELAGAEGNDTIAGNGGNDTLVGDEGNDVLNGGTENDSLLGGDGNDNLIGGAGNDSLDGGAGNDSMNGGAGNDQYRVDSLADKIADSGGIDIVFSSLDSYTLANGIESLTLVGTATTGIGNGGNNQLRGSGGVNLLCGLGGNDTIFASGAADTMVGGAGADSFALAAATPIDLADVIADFQMGIGGDVISLGAGITGSAAEREIVANYVQTVESGGNTIVRIDVDGLGSGATFVDAFVLQGINTDLEGLLTNGNISTAAPA
jgi:Ca2+-binding RTX toxin-like protein